LLRVFFAEGEGKYGRSVEKTHGVYYNNYICTFEKEYVRKETGEISPEEMRKL
jgi:hypothetical protein